MPRLRSTKQQFRDFFEMAIYRAKNVDKSAEEAKKKRKKKAVKVSRKYGL